MANLKAGQKVGRYSIIRELGSGGFGVTYLANSEDLGIKVAIKEYFPAEFAIRRGASIKARSKEQKNFDWGKKRFLQEARTLAKFRNPNIVGVRQIFEENNTAYMVLDYESGRNLKAWRKEINDQPTEQELIEITLPILSALEVIHSNDLLHRDISPDNIIVRNDGTPVLIDFGSSRSMVQKTRTVSAMVKSGYSPPELYSSLTDSQGPWSDIYSYAATIYFLITGKAPDEATNRVVRDRMEPLATSHAGQYAASFLQAVDAGLNLNTDRRPQTVSAWLHMLGLAEKGPEAASVWDPVTDAKPSAKRNRTRNLIGLVAAAALALFFIGNFNRSPNADNPLEPSITQSETPGSKVYKEQLPISPDPGPETQEDELAQVPPPNICAGALNWNRTDWEDNPSFQDEVEEARRRQFTITDCRLALGLPASITPPTPDLTQMPAAEICRSALNSPRTGWDMDGFYQDKVKEAQRRGLTVESCRIAMGVPLQQPVGPSAENYGIIAYSYVDNHWTVAWNQPSQAQATLDAIKSCNSKARNCQVVTVFNNACGAVASGQDAWGADWATTREHAEFLAVRKCQGQTSGCRPWFSFCSPPDGTAGPNVRDYSSLSPDASAEYVEYAETDFWQGDLREIKNTDYGSCKTACSEDTTCHAFSFDKSRNVCILKNFSGTEIPALGRTDVDSAVKADFNNAVSVKGLYYEPNISLTGWTIRNFPSNLDGCMAACLDEAKCQGFTYKRKLGTCTMFSRWWSRRPDPGQISGARSPEAE